jgi:tetratricopeptide (TPR) repeat protein
MPDQEPMLKQGSSPGQGVDAPRSEKGWPTIVGVAAAALILVVAGLAARHFFRSPPAVDEAQAHWQEAQELIAAREFPQATEHLAQCLEAWPYNGEANFLMARTWRRAGNPGNSKIYLDRAEILRWPKKQIELERQLRRAQVGDVWDVEDHLMELLNTQPPEEVIILEALVAGLMEADRLIDAIAVTTTWADRYPEDWLALILRGNAKLRLYGKSGDAAKDFRRVLELKPNDPDAHLALALVLNNQGDFREAMPHFQTYLASQPNDPTEALFGLANCQFSLGYTDDARASLEQLFARNKDHPMGCFLQAKVESADGRDEEALKWLEKADRLAPDESDVTSALLQVCRQLGRKEDVARYEERLKKIRVRDDQLDRLLTLAKTKPDDPEVRYPLGMICLSRGRDQEASHWFQGILYKNPNHLATLTTLADYYQKKGNARMAAHYRRKANIASGKALAKPPEQARK